MAPSRGRPEALFSRLDELVEALTRHRLSALQQRQFQQYLDVLLDWNKTHRLTGDRTPTAIVRNLFEDSVLFLSEMPSGPLKLADIGSGAGIPGVPLRLVRPDIEVTLIESMRKRVSFLASLRRALELDDVRIVEGRVEQLVQDEPSLEAVYDVAVSRALPGLPLLFPAVLRLLKPGGRLVMAGPPPEKASHALGEYRTLRLPGLGVSRRFIVVAKSD